MSVRRVYLDTGVLIAAFRGKDDLAANAMAVLDDPDNAFVLSEYVRLEVIPKPVFHKNSEEVEFMQTILDGSEIVTSTPGIMDEAFSLACRYGLSAIDALPISSAITANVDEFVTSEKPEKPFFRVREVWVRSIRQG
jgi:predicted nucleic acid-binding protein